MWNFYSLFKNNNSKLFNLNFKKVFIDLYNAKERQCMTAPVATPIGGGWSYTVIKPVENAKLHFLAHDK